MVDEHPESPTGRRLELRDDGGQVVDAAEVLDYDTLDPKVVAPHLFDEFGVVAALDVDPAGERHPGAWPATATEPDAVLVGAAGAARRGGVRMTGFPSIR